jgi:hypothetical protein
MEHLTIQHSPFENSLKAYDVLNNSMKVYDTLGNYAKTLDSLKVSMNVINPLYDFIKNSMEIYDRINHSMRAFDTILNYNNDFSLKDVEDFELTEQGDDSILTNNVIPIYVNINNTNYTVSENEINEQRLQYLKTKISPLFISLVKNEDFEFGQKSESIKLVENELEINKIATACWLNDLYLQYFLSDEKVLIGILRVIEYFDEGTLYPNAPTIALACLSHRSDEIKEIGVRIFENWGTLKSYETLKGVKTDTKWLQSYINQVIKDIETELCLS